MKKSLALVFLLGVTALGTGCAENEQTLLIEHVKSQPDAPECAVTSGDPVIFQGRLDVYFNNPYTGWLLITNQAMSRENYQSVKAESNGIFVDYAEVYVENGDGIVGERTREVLEYYLEPEASNVAQVTLVPKDVLTDLQLLLNCPPISTGQLPGSGEVVDIVAVARVFGHTAGGAEVESQEFGFKIELCCGCLINWANCAEPCSQFCEDVEADGMCTTGVYNGTEKVFDCRNFYSRNATWGGCAEDEDHVDTDSDTVRACNCEDDC